MDGPCRGTLDKNHPIQGSLTPAAPGPDTPALDPGALSAGMMDNDAKREIPDIPVTHDKPPARRVRRQHLYERTMAFGAMCQ